jgi:transcription antitermination factor NusA-like protein
MDKIKLDGMKLSELKRIEEISYYNHNIYVYGSDLIKAISDDDNTTELYLITDTGLVLIGECFTSEGDIIHIIKEALNGKE